MDKELLQKFFRNLSSLDETEEVLNWFQTEEGQEYLEKNLDRDMNRYADEENLLLSPDVPSGKMLTRIRQTRKSSHKRINHSNWFIKVAVVLLICSTLAVNYWVFNPSEEVNNEEPKITYRTISTHDDQHRLVRLGDGTHIRLNSNSSIRLPEQFPGNERPVTLEGEAWFQVAKDEDRPFSVRTDRATVRVLGTEFNIKADTLSGNVQIAVAEGKVALHKNSIDENDGIEAILIQNTFAVYNSRTDEILIENSPVENYLSWISGRLYFYDDPLWIVSRYLERLYGVTIRFDEAQLRELTLSIDLAKEDLESVLGIISQTLDIDHNHQGNNILWTFNKQHLTTNQDE